VLGPESPLCCSLRWCRSVARAVAPEPQNGTPAGFVHADCHRHIGQPDPHINLTFKVA
jgi:hypothetical protein